MKKYNILIALVGMLAVPALQAAVSVGSTGTITLNTGPNSVGVGGEFIATGYGGLSGLGTFSTFCLEHSEVFTPGGTYNATVNLAAIGGGVNTSSSVVGSDPLSMGTAWLYSQFRAGTLAGYSSGLTATAGQLQNAIWWLEGEITADQSANPFITQIPNAAWRAYNSGTDANGAFGVVALNLTYPNGGRAQDQLALVPVPVPEPTTIIAGALLLLPFAVSTFRRSRKS